MGRNAGVMSKPFLIVLVLGGVGLFLATAAVGTFTVDFATQRFAVIQERWAADSDVLVTLQGNSNSNNNRSATGTVCPGEEASKNNPQLRSDLTQGNLLYEVLIQENSSTAWIAGRTYKAEVFADSSLIDSRFFKNDTVDANNVEGVRLFVDLGSPSSPPESYSTVITRVNGCP